jgi:hypothetical protein
LSKDDWHTVLNSLNGLIRVRRDGGEG